MPNKRVESPNEAEDNFFKYKGVKPPERRSHGIREDEIDEMLAANFKDHKCTWYQSGNFLKCTSGAYEHGLNIGINKRYTGVDTDGSPMFEDITLS